MRSFITAVDPIIACQYFLRTYVEPKVAPVELDAGLSFAIPIVSLILLLGALIAAGLMIRPRYFSRLTWAGASLICVVGAVMLTRATVVEIRNPFAGPPAEAAAAKIITAVLDNVHAAYLERTEPELGKALGVVVADSGFTDVKAELSRALAIKVAGGGIARVNKIEGLVVKDIAAIDGRPGFRSVVEWTAQGTGEASVMKNLFSYEGKRVVITGSASGMGAATAEIVRSLGADRRQKPWCRPPSEALA